MHCPCQTWQQKMCHVILYLAKLLCGSYLLQVNRAKFNQYEIDSTCIMCKKGIEDRCHFLLHCTALSSAKEALLTKIKRLLLDEIRSVCTQNDSLLTRIILNCPTTHTRLNVTYALEYKMIECVSRELWFALHNSRARLMSYRP